MTITIGNASVNRTASKLTEGVAGVNKAGLKLNVGDGGVNRQVFSASLASYGDGANNGVANAYTNLIYVGTPGANSLYTAKGTYTIAGNWYNMRSWWSAGGFTASALQSVTPASGTNTVTITMPAETWHLLSFSAGSGTTSVSVSSLYLNVGGTYYTLQQCVANGYIYPLVLMGSSQSTGAYYFSNWHLMYTAGASGTGSYPWGGVMFKPKVAISGYKYTTNKAWSAADKASTQQITTIGYEMSLAAF